MESKPEPEGAPVLLRDDNLSATVENGSVDSNCYDNYAASAYDIDASSTCIPHPRAATLGYMSESWRSNSGLDLHPVPERMPQGARSVNDSLDSSMSASLDGQVISVGMDEGSILQAVVFIEDAYNYRSINHKVTPEELHLYRVYRSQTVVAVRVTVITILHLLAFVEYPSSLTWSSDPRYRAERFAFPCWVTQSLELLCLALLVMDNIIRIHLMGFRYFFQNKWDMLSMLILSFSFVDWCVSFAMGCHEFIRFRRILRPFFLVQNSSLMKKIVRCLRRTMPEVISVLLLLFFHLFIFTLLGMLLFPEIGISPSNSTGPDPWDERDEGSLYFESLLDSFISLLVLLTTANNPDVTMPAYSHNRLASIFFILYLVIGLYFFMNVLLAVIYNQFRGYFLSSMQSSLIRRRLAIRAAFEVLLSKMPKANHFLIEMEIGMGAGLIRSVIVRCQLPQYIKSTLLEELENSDCQVFSATQFQKLFSAMDKDIVHKQTTTVRWCSHPRLRKLQRIFLHKYFTYFGIFVAAFNLLIITVELGLNKDNSLLERHSQLMVFNFMFVVYYVLEQMLKLWANGWRKYISDPGNVFDAIITLALVAGEIVVSSLDGSPFASRARVTKINGSPVLWNIIRMINILIMVRMFKMVPYIKSMNLVASVLLDLIKNMRSFLGISVVCFYAFAIMGIELFHGKIKYKPEMANQTFQCGSYEQLEYWANNFDDFFASVVVLWDVMVVNNWQVFLYVFKDRTSPWSYVYFIAWWLISVIIVLNLFTALIMENFIMKWDRRGQMGTRSYESATVPVHLNTVHSMFKDLLQEPAETELLSSLGDHHFLRVRHRAPHTYRQETQQREDDD